MKKLLFILLLTIPFIGFGQEIITNQIGEKIILNKDNTWEYLEVKEEEKDSTNYMYYVLYYDVKQDDISKFINMSGLDIVKGFDVKNYDFLDYYGNPQSKYSSCHYLVKDVNNKTGFFYSPDNNMELVNILDKKNLIELGNKETPLNIIGTRIEKINSVGGVDFSITWKYLDNTKDIKYVYFTVIPYNCVGDQIGGKYNTSGKFNGKITGPISSSNERIKSYWSNSWYNNTICSIEIIKVKVEYMDGSKYTYVNELSKISSPYLKYYSF